MRIAMISTPFLAVPPRDYGGTELVVYELVEGLVERGHDVTLFATGDSRVSADLRAFYKQARWPPDPLIELNHVSWAFQQAAAGDFDLIHTHCAAALALGRLRPGVPLVYTLHHEREPILSEYYSAFPEVQYVAISADQKGREMPLPRCDVIHHGLDPAHYQLSEAPGDHVCFVGRFARVKGPHTAIDVAARAGVPIRVAGEVHAPDRTFARDELEWRLAQPHVRYLGCIGMDAKTALLRDALALVAPVEWNEPFGLILIEALLSGCPVVAFGRGSVPELIEHGVTGFVVDTVDAMVETIRPGGPLQGFDRRRCQAHAVRRFSRARMVSDHERLYQRVTARTTGGGERRSQSAA
jgi:glycosyltransferase involved in cell wall biosynthesis